MIKKFVLKRDDGQYFSGHWQGQASVVDDVYYTTQYSERGARAARGWLIDKERWSIVAISITIKEDE